MGHLFKGKNVDIKAKLFKNITSSSLMGLVRDHYV